jgi:predicted  nucleic acid-binding Zn-ribbon protein
MSQPTQLLRLQRIDDQLRAGKQRLGEVIQGMNEPQSLLDLRESAEIAQLTLAAAQTKQRDLELQFSGLSAKHKEADDYLYSGKIKNSRELADLQQEVQMLQRRKEFLEEDVLENLVLVEAAAERVADANEVLAAAEAGWQSTYTTLQAEKLSLATSLNALIGKRKQRMASIDKRMLKTYLQLAQKKRNGVAVATLKINQCTGCQTTQPAMIVKEVEQGQMVYCNSCGRILVQG